MKTKSFIIFITIIFCLSSCQQIKRLKAQWGNAEDKIELGKQYEHGDELKKDLKEAVKWYQMASDDGNA